MIPGLFALSLIVAGTSAQGGSEPSGSGTLTSTASQAPGGSSSLPIGGAELDQCAADHRSFARCAKDTLAPGSEELTDLANTIQANVTGCFDEHQCSPPSNTSDSGVDKIKLILSQISQPVKQCISKRFTLRFAPKLKQCLEQQGLQGLNFTELAELPNIEDEISNHSALEESFGANLQMVKALRECANEKGNDTNAIKPLEQCLQGTKCLGKEKVCDILHPCGSNVSERCLTLGQEVTSAFCKCKLEKEQEILQKLNNLLRGSSQKISFRELIGAFVSPQEIKQASLIINQCFKDSKQQKPKELQWFLAFLQVSGGSNNTSDNDVDGESGGSNSTQSGLTNVPIDMPTVHIIRDLIEIDVNDKKQCEPCTNWNVTSSSGVSSDVDKSDGRILANKRLRRKCTYAINLIVLRNRISRKATDGTVVKHFNRNVIA